MESTTSNSQTHDTSDQDAKRTDGEASFTTRRLKGDPYHKTATQEHEEKINTRINQRAQLPDRDTLL